jgi:hypothetical protein
LNYKKKKKMGNGWCSRKNKNAQREAFKKVSAHETRDLMRFVFTSSDWKDFLAYCDRCGVDGQEVSDWTDAILEKEYGIRNPLLREFILNDGRNLMIEFWMTAASKRQ